jgi:hypothetical protein
MPCLPGSHFLSRIEQRVDLFCPPSENHMAGSTLRLEHREGYNVLELCFRLFNGSMDKSRQVPLDLETIGPWSIGPKACDSRLTENLGPG